MENDFDFISIFGCVMFCYCSFYIWNRERNPIEDAFESGSIHCALVCYCKYNISSDFHKKV